MIKKSVVVTNAKKIIESKGLKQKAVAQRMNCTERQLSDILNFRKIVDSEIVENLCNALNVTPNDLFGYQCNV